MEKGGRIANSLLRTHDGLGLRPFSWPTAKILFTASWFKHRITDIQS